jgi:hypothetical protein
MQSRRKAITGALAAQATLFEKHGAELVGAAFDAGDPR